MHFKPKPFLKTFSTQVSLACFLIGVFMAVAFVFLLGEGRWSAPGSWLTILGGGVFLAVLGALLGKRVDWAEALILKLKERESLAHREVAQKVKLMEQAQANSSMIERDLEKLRRIVTEQEHEVRKLNKELEFEIRRSATQRTVLGEVKDKHRHLEQRLQQRTKQFDRVKREMEHQIKERVQTEEELLETQDRLKMINSLSIRLNAGTPLDELIHHAVKELKKVFGDLRVYFAGIEEERILRLSQTTHVQGLSQFLGLPINIDNAPAYKELLKAGEPVIVEDLSLDPRLRPLLPHYVTRGAAGMLEVPILHRHKLVGLLGLGSYEPRVWANYEINALTEIAQFLTLALKDAEVEQERQRAATQLMRAKDAAELATRTKSDFLATMSHEIRTPLNGIIGMTNLLAGTNLSKEQREYTHIINSSGEILLTLINDILDFSKIEAGKLELEHINFNLRDTMEETGEILAVKAQPKGLELVVNLPFDIPVRLKGDPGRLSQILINLMNNAIKFTEHGEVRAEVNLVKKDQKHLTLEFRVVDTGIGIPQDRINHLFESFTQVDASTTRKYGGSGLGLAICKRLTELMQGRIWVESKVGRGSTFCFTAVLELQETQNRPGYNMDPDLMNMNLFLIEPNSHTRKALADAIRSLGVTVLAASDPEDSLDLIQETTLTGKKIAALLVDHTLFEGARKKLVQKIHTAVPGTPLVLMAPLIEKLGHHYAGADVVVTKPVRLESLRRSIRVALGIDTPLPLENAVSAPILTPGPKPGRILLVDDNEVNRKLVALLLKKGEFQFDTAVNGREAVEAISVNDYSVVLMDCRMPEMDGFEATREIRRREGDEKHTPIIALTASAMADDRTACLDAGMDDYLTKPVNADKLFEALKEYHPEITDAPPLVEETPQNTHSEPVELHRLKDATSNDPELIIEMIELFLSETERTMREIETAVENRSSDSLREVAHSLKGSCSNMGAVVMQEYAGALEKMAVNFEMDGTEEVFSKLKEAHLQVVSYLENAVRETQLS